MPTRRQVGVGAADEDVDIVTLDDSETTPAVPEPPKKSPKEKHKKKRKKLVQQESDSQLVIRSKKPSPAQPAQDAEADGRPDRTAEILNLPSIHSAEDGAILATEVASVQEPEDPVLGTDEVRLTHRVEPVVETVKAQTPMIADRAREERGARDPTDTERETVPVSPLSSPGSTEATAVVPAERTVREQANEIMMMLKMAMERVCAWSERVEAQTSETAGREATIWKRRLANCEESFKRKGTALTEAEKGQAELQKTLEAKDAELATVRAEMETERRARTNTEQLRRELREAQAEVKSLRRQIGVLRGDVDEARRNERMSTAFELLTAEQ
jgi:hypothetical protein